MKRSLFLIPFGFFVSANAQSLQGKLSDKQQNPLEDWEIVVTKDKTKTSSITDQNGNYLLKLPENGQYLVEVFSENQKIFSDTVSVNGDTTQNISVPTPEKSNSITENKNIQGVTLTARKKLVERKVDRLVFNVENSVASQGIDAMEALAKTPMIRATDTSISIAGKSSVAVMINDRLLNLSGDELINYLKTIRSDDIAKIEVITTPPAKYEAEGKSGLINIILKKNTSLGWNGTLQTSGVYYWNRPTVSTRSSASVNYQGKKLSVSANASLGDNFWQQKNYTHNIGENYYWNTDTESGSNYRYKGINVKGEYKINDKNLVGISYNYSYSNPLETASNTSSIDDHGEKQSFLSDAHNLNHRNVHNATAFYEVKLDSLDSKLTVSGNIMRNRSNADNFYNTYTDTQTYSTYVNPVNQYRIYSGQADLEKNFKKLKTEAGLKYTKIRNNSDFNYYDILNSQNVLNTDRSNTFLYNEENYAAYFSASYKFSEKWDAKAGLRYEYTDLKGISPNEDLTSKNHYGKLFPTAYISYKPNDDHAFSINYSRRISRPYFGNLNPFKYYSSEFEYYSGNPYLYPSFTDNLELNYVLKNNFTTTFYYNHNKDNWDRIQRIENGIKYSTVLNFYNENQTGISVNYNFNKLKWLESNFYATAYYSKSKSFIPDAVAELDGYGSNFNMENNFFLNQQKTFTFIFGAWGDFPNRSGNTYFKTNYALYSGLKLNLMDKNLMINLYMNDLLNTNESKGTEYYQTFNSDYSYKGISRNIYLSVTYKFGNNNVKGATKQVKFEEQNRAN